MVRADEAAATSALALRAEAHRGCDPALREACRAEPPRTGEQVLRDDVLAEPTPSVR